MVWSDNIEWASFDLPFFERRLISAYVENGANPGAFMMAVFSNSLWAAVDYAEHEGPGHLERLPVYVRLMRTHMPRESYGSGAAVHKWINFGGQKGFYGL